MCCSGLEKEERWLNEYIGHIYKTKREKEEKNPSFCKHLPLELLVKHISKERVQRVDISDSYFYFYRPIEKSVLKACPEIVQRECIDMIGILIP